MAKQPKETLSESAKAEKLVRKKVGDEAADGLMEMDRDQLKAKLVALAKYTLETANAKAEDNDLAEAKERAAEMAAPYNDTIKGCAAQTRFATMLLESKGG